MEVDHWTFYFFSLSISPYISSINEISSIGFFINNRSIIELTVKIIFESESKLIANLKAVFTSFIFPLILEPIKFIVKEEILLIIIFPSISWFVKVDYIWEIKSIGAEEYSLLHDWFLLLIYHN